MSPNTTKQQSLSSEPIINESSACVHHWIIEAPDGRESMGSCKHCGVAKEFSNSNESVMWEQTNSLRNEARTSSGASSRFSKPAEIRLSDE